MKTHVFLVVIRNVETDEISIGKFTEPEHVIHAISQFKTSEVERIFSVDEFGEVEHYDIVFKGKLKLVNKEKF
jgi:hypothetical protein